MEVDRAKWVAAKEDGFYSLYYRGSLRDSRWEKFICSDTRTVKELPPGAIVLEEFSLEKELSGVRVFSGYTKEHRLVTCIRMLPDNTWLVHFLGPNIERICSIHELEEMLNMSSIVIVRKDNE